MRESKFQARRRRAARSRLVIGRSRRLRVVAHRSTRHTYAQLIDPENRTLFSASTLEKSLRDAGPTGTVAAARAVGERLASKIMEADIKDDVAFDRCGFKYHGRIKAVADGMRDSGVNL